VPFYFLPSGGVPLALVVPPAWPGVTVFFLILDNGTRGPLSDVLSSRRQAWQILETIAQRSDVSGTEKTARFSGLTGLQWKSAAFSEMVRVKRFTTFLQFLFGSRSLILNSAAYWN
jgi:hypothetical protein